MNGSQYIPTGIKILLTTTFAILLLNFACANKAGVHILAWVGSIENSDIYIWDNILRGVELMQNIIYLVALVGIFLSLYFFAKGIYFQVKATK